MIPTGYNEVLQEKKTCQNANEPTGNPHTDRTGIEPEPLR